MPIVLADTDSPAAIAFEKMVDNIIEQIEQRGEKS
jgi:hypothetical protein